MKPNIFILPVVVCALVTTGSWGSDCIGNDCDLQQMSISAPTELGLHYLEELGESTESTSAFFGEGLCSGDCYAAQDMGWVVHNAFGSNCPFQTKAECNIWRKKPMMRETVSPRSPRIQTDKMQAFISAAHNDNCISADAPVSAPLLSRYLSLMQSARACCTQGMIYNLQHDGASQSLVYKYLSDDANFYDIGNRCLMMTDAEIDNIKLQDASHAMVSDVRNGCLCRGRQWYIAMLAPFAEVYNAVPEFAACDFSYTYVDGLQREITVSINRDVEHVLNQLASCP